jgi:hypothetical protein
MTESKSKDKGKPEETKKSDERDISEVNTDVMKKKEIKEILKTK